MKSALHRRVARPGFLACLLLLVSHLAASAHPNLQDAMWVQFGPQLVRVAVNVSLKAPLLRYGSAVISCCGAYYLVVALHEQFFSR